MGGSIKPRALALGRDKHLTIKPARAGDSPSVPARNSYWAVAHFMGSYYFFPLVTQG